MNHKLQLFALQFKKARSIFRRKPKPFIDIPKGGCVLVFHDMQAFHNMINALGEAQKITGFNYPYQVLQFSELFKN